MLVALLSLVAVFAQSAAMAAVGRTQGTFAVAPSGAAAYLIPLWTPPGVGAADVELALQYSSAAPNGVLGIGWTLSIESSIDRCAAGYAQLAGSPAPIALATSDRYCLDGQLLKLTGGTYGAAGSTYQTEIDGFSRITAYGSAGSGPAYFVVERKDGTIAEYGFTSDSRIEAAGGLNPTVRTWAVNKIRDRVSSGVGNSVQFVYAEDTTNRGYRLTEIQYPYTATGQGPFYRVRLLYEARPAADTLSYFVGNYQTIEPNRVDRIDIEWNNSGWQLLRRYELSYATAPATNRSRMTQVQECAGAVGNDCLNPTTIGYQDGTGGWAGETSSGQAITLMANSFPIDVDGDGLDDLVYPNSGTSTFWIVPATVSGYAAAVNTGVSSTNYASALSLDFNSDGRMDLLLPNTSNNWRVLQSTGTGFTVIDLPTPVVGTSGNSWTADYDGDGRPDLVYATNINVWNSQLRGRKNTGSGFSSTEEVLFTVDPYQQFSSGTGSPFGSQFNNFRSEVRTGDFDADGRTDLLVRIRFDRSEGGSPPNWRYDWHVLSARGTSYVRSGSFLGSGITSQPTVVDINADGFADAAFPGATTWQIAFGKGSSGVTVVPTTVPNGTAVDAQFADWDGDGRMDLITRVGSLYYYSRFNGVSFDAPVSTGIPFDSTLYNPRLADKNGDGLADWLYVDGSGVLKWRLHAGVRADLATNFTDGFGVSQAIQYGSIAQGGYTRLADAVFPYQDLQTAMYVVTGLTASNGIGGTYTQSFLYSGLQLNLQGRGVMGFYSQRVLDSRNGLFGYSYFRRDFPYAGQVLQRDVLQPDNVTLMSRAQLSWNMFTMGAGAESRHFPYVSSNTVDRYEAGGPRNGAWLARVVQSTTVDAYGSPTQLATTTTNKDSLSLGHNEVHTVQQTNTIGTNDTSNWCLGRPTSIAITSTLPGGSALTRTASASYDYVACRTTQRVIEPNSGTLKVTTDYGFDLLGNVNSEAVTGIGMATRTSTVNWGSSGQFPLSVTVPVAPGLNHTTQKGWDISSGVQLSETDPNGLVTSWLYDAFARRTRETRADGTYSTQSFTACDASNSYCGTGQAYGRYRLDWTEYGVGGTAITHGFDYFDMVNRRYLALGLNFSGASYDAAYEYRDALGRVVTRSNPFPNGGASTGWRAYSYDLQNRVTVDSLYDGSGTLRSSASISYRGLTTVATDELAKTKTVIRNAVGQVVRSVDHDSYYQQFSYEPFGNAVSVSDSASSNLQSATFNVRGFRTASTDIDLGSWGYAYNALGEMTSHTDANGQTTSYTYDYLGRRTGRSEPAPGGGTISSQWAWGSDPASKNIGRLAYVFISGSGVDSYFENYYYDSAGRASLTDYGLGAATHSVNLSYSATTGLLESLEYPTSTAGYRHKIVYEYQNGMLRKVRDFANTVTYWQANAQDPRGNVTNETLGNGLVTSRGFDQATGLPSSIQTGPGGGGATQNLSYTWNLSGHLVSRSDANQSLTETFSYDNLYRLDYSQLNGSTNLDVSYAANGNISWRSDVGSYTYHTSKIHAVATAGGLSYGYDANGNVTAKNGATAVWYATNQPKSLSNGAYSSTFEYSPDGNYWKQTATFGNGTETSHYVGGLLEIVLGPTVTAWRHHIRASGRTVAIYTRGSNGVNTTIYPLADHLGSTEAITNASGAILVKESFAAFGARRGSNWSGSPSGSDMVAIGDATRRGYTAHTMLDNIGLVHMNGRVFDPVVGRFLSADPYIDGELNTQGWNRYSYVRNDPLSATDPTGFCTGTHICPDERKKSTGQTPKKGDSKPDRRFGRWVWSWSRYSHVSADGVTTSLGGWQGWVYDPGSSLSHVGGLSFGSSGRRGSIVGNSYAAATSVPSSQPASGFASRALTAVGEAFGVPLFICIFESGLPGACSGDDWASAGLGYGSNLASAGAGGIVLKGAKGAAGLLDDAARAGATVFKTGHYASRLEAAGVNVARAESVVAKEVAAMRSNMATGADVGGRLRIDNVLVEYRARLLPDGSVNVGTIFPVR